MSHENAEYEAGEKDAKMKMDARLEELRDRWAASSRQIRHLFGEDEPAAKAFDSCVTELYDAMHGEVRF